MSRSKIQIEQFRAPAEARELGSALSPTSSSGHICYPAPGSGPLPGLSPQMGMCPARAWLLRGGSWTAHAGKWLLLPFTGYHRALESCKKLVKWSVTLCILEMRTPRSRSSKLEVGKPSQTRVWLTPKLTI